MRLRKLILREIHMRLVAAFETSFGKSELRRILLVVVDVDGVSGWGESTARATPFYSYETVETAWHILREHVWPLVRNTEIGGASEVFDRLAQIRGHNMAKAALEAP